MRKGKEEEKGEEAKKSWKGWKGEWEWEQELEELP